MITQDKLNSYIAYLETQQEICKKINYALWLIEQKRVDYDNTWQDLAATKQIILTAIEEQTDIVSDLSKQLNVLAQNNPLVIEQENKN